MFLPPFRFSDAQIRANPSAVATAVLVHPANLILGNDIIAAAEVAAGLEVLG